jgi:hypothetical protein
VDERWRLVAGASGSKMGARNASNPAREVKVADWPEAMCSTRPCHTRRDGPEVSRNCTTNARCTDRIDLADGLAVSPT